MADKLDKLDYYTLLGVEEDASADAIRAAFHTFALKFHPDNHGADPQKSARATEIFRRGTEAYRVLCNPTARTAYDKGLAKGALRLKAEEAKPRRRKGSSRGAVGLRAAPFFTKAKRALKSGDHPQAKLHLKIALTHEPDNPALLALLDEVDAK